MNRIKISPLASTPVSQQPVENAGTSLLESFQDLPFAPEFSVYAPLHYESSYAYPLIVWLHSDGDDCGQLQRVMPDVSLRNYVGIAPESPNGNHNKGFYWPQDCDSVEQAHDGILAAIDYASCRYHLNTQRIFLAGYGNGGTMAFRVAFQRPELFAGVISLNGSLPEGRCPLGRLPSSRNVPVFWAHCRQSAEFDQDDLCAQLKLLHVGGFSVTVRQYPCGDRLVPNMLGDVDRWVMESIDSAII